MKMKVKMLMQTMIQQKNNDASGKLKLISGSSSEGLDLLSMISQMKLDAIESSNVLNLLSNLNGLKLGKLNTFISSQISLVKGEDIPDSIVSREAISSIIQIWTNYRMICRTQTKKKNMEENS